MMTHVNTRMRFILKQFVGSRESTRFLQAEGSQDHISDVISRSVGVGGSHLELLLVHGLFQLVVYVASIVNLFSFW